MATLSRADVRSTTPDPGSADPDLVERTAEAARAAAGRAGVTIRILQEPTEMVDAAALAARVWRSNDTSQLDASLLRALAYTGNFVAGAFDQTADADLVGLSVGFLTAHPAYGLHSHMTCTADGRRDGGLGAALKLYQRAWALVSGLTSVSWTFDPLVRRNAYFNLGKLGARVEAYLPDFYGPMEDGVNVGDESDRILMTWDVTGDPDPAASGSAAEADFEPAGAALLASGPEEEPQRFEVDGNRVACQVPADIVALRERDPGLALRWRHELRDAMLGARSRGYRVQTFTRSGFYVLGPGPLPGETSAEGA